MGNNEVIHRSKKPLGLSARIGNYFQRIFVFEKLNNWVGILIFAIVATGMGFLMAEHSKWGFGVTGMIIGAGVAIVCIISAEAGLYITLIYSFFVSFFNRLLFDDALPVGVLSDLLIASTFLGFIIRNVKLKQTLNKFTKTPVVMCLLIVYGYMAIELFNPNAGSFSGWFPAFRKILGTLLLLFTSFQVFDSLEKIKRFLKVLFVACLIVALYTCFQQYHGFFEFEMNWLRADPKRFRMTFIGGGSKKMSTMLDALSVAIIMASCSVFFIALTTSIKQLGKKVLIGICIIIMLLAMTYAMTRTANAMLVGGLFMFMLLTLNKASTRLMAAGGILAFIVLLYAPIENPQVDSFRSTFEGKKDASFNVREENRKSVQPYIHRHPIGGGLNTTGGEGLMYSPGHYLAGFPPDSGALKKALEMGWIGFGLLCILYFLVLRTGIRGYFACKNEEIKLIYAAATAACFSFYIGDFSQVAIGQITDIVVYYPMIAIILKLKEFDEPIKT